jgi:hypothetical protein
MSLSYDDMRPCLFCGAPCDGDVCDTRCEQALWDMERETEEENAEPEEDE